MSKRAVIYARLSLAKDGDTAGVERQEEACRALAEARGWDVVAVEVDNNISASKGLDRPAWQRVLSMADAGEVDVILAYHLDRITRSMTELETLITLSERTGVGIATATGDIDLSNDQGQLIARILGAVARAEGDRKAARQRIESQQRVEAGRPRWAHRPFGYADKSGTALDEREAAALRQVYLDLLAGVPLAELSRRLNAQGIYTSKDKPWVAQTLRPLLLSPRNAGIITYHGKEAGRGQWPSVVSEELFRAAERLLTSRKPGKAAGPGRSLLTNWATCAACGAGLRRGRRVNKGESVYLYYLCHGGHVAIDAEFLEAYVLRKAVARVSSMEAREWTGTVPEAVDVSALLAEERALGERLADLGRLFAQGTIDLAALQAGTKSGQATLAELKEQIAAAGADAAAEIVDVELLYQAAEDMETERLRKHLQRVIATVTVAPRGKGNRKARHEAVRITFADGTTEGGGPV